MAVSTERLSYVPTRTCSTEAKDTGPCRQKGLEIPTQAQRDTVPRGFTQDGASRTCREARVHVFLDTHPTACSALLTLGRREPASPCGVPCSPPVLWFQMSGQEWRVLRLTPDCQGHEMQMRQTYPMGG